MNTHKKEKWIPKIGGKYYAVGVWFNEKKQAMICVVEANRDGHEFHPTNCFKRKSDALKAAKKILCILNQ